MSYSGYTNDDVCQAVKECTSIRQVIHKLGLIPAGGNYQTIKNLIKKHKLDTLHFRGQGWRKDKTFQPTRPIEDYLNNQYSVQSDRLRKRLINEGYFPHQCQLCKVKEWLQSPIPLELHHKDCNHNNNNLPNLMLVCPNCHTYLHRQLRNKKVSQPKLLAKPKPTKPNGRAKPRPTTRKTIRPTLDILENDIKRLGYCGTGRKYKVSDNAIRKWVKMYQKYPISVQEEIRTLTKQCSINTSS